MIRLHISVTTIINGWVHETLDGERASWEGSGFVPVTKNIDRFSSINARGSARAGIELEEKLGGPRDTFSSITIRVIATTPCDPSEKAFNAAHDACAEQCAEALERYVDEHMDRLIRHLGKER